MPRGSQGFIRGARGSQTGLTETAWRRPKLPRSCLGRLWDLPGRPPGTILEYILIPNLMILLQTFLKPFFESFKAQFHVWLFCPTFQIHCNFQWNLHVFRFGPFQKYMQNLYRKTWKFVQHFIKNLKYTPNMHNKLQESHPTVNCKASKGQEKQK